MRLEEAKAKLESAYIKEYTSGREYSINNDSSITVSEERIYVIARVSNTGGGSGTIVAELIVNGQSMGQKSKNLSSGDSVEFKWGLEIPEGVKQTMSIKVGHESGGWY